MVGIAVVTGSTGLVGSETSRMLSRNGLKVVGIDNDMRKEFFGADASTSRMRSVLMEELDDYEHRHVDIRDREELQAIFEQFSGDIEVVVHTAAQPSHDWAANDPFADFSVNANGTHNLLEFTRMFCPEAVFIFTSTNKVYGDRPNLLPINEAEQRFELDPSHQFFRNGIDESMSIDQSMHSLFGASKVAADILVQEYGRYFGLKTGIFRGGCLTGLNHAGVPLHGFLSHLTKCVLNGQHYEVFGYKGKQVRDNLHARDLASMFWSFIQNPRAGEVYNAGGGRDSSCSILEAIDLAEVMSSKRLNWSYSDRARAGDHVWYISDVSKFKSHYPDWNQEFFLEEIMSELLLLPKEASA